MSKNLTISIVFGISLSVFCVIYACIGNETKDEVVLEAKIIKPIPTKVVEQNEEKCSTCNTLLAKNSSACQVCENDWRKKQEALKQWKSENVVEQKVSKVESEPWYMPFVWVFAVLGTIVGYGMIFVGISRLGDGGFIFFWWN